MRGGRNIEMKKLSIENFPFLNLSILNSRLAWSITIRWLIIAGYFAATLISYHIFHLAFPYGKIWTVLTVLALINSIYLVIFKLYKHFSFQSEVRFLQIHILVDIIILTILIHYAGGIENPIYLFYAFHVVLSSILFPSWRPVLITTFIVIFFGALVYLEYAGILYHYSIFNSDLHSDPYFVFIVLAVFTITVYVTMYICMSFMFIYRNIKRQMDIQNRQLVQADREKAKFFRFTSHELKAPVVAIKSSLDSILKNYGGKIDGRIEDLLRRSSSRANQMLQIIRELLELSKNRLKIVEKEIQQIDINLLIREIIEQESVRAEEKSIRIQQDLSRHAAKINMDPADFKEIFANLFINAINYTHQGGTIKVNSVVAGEKLVFSIEDTGIGIAEFELDKIFDEFYRSEKAKNEIQFGTGLGLSLVKQIVENYRGKMNVSSEINKGSRFEIELPVA